MKCSLVRAVLEKSTETLVGGSIQPNPGVVSREGFLEDVLLAL